MKGERIPGSSRLGGFNSYVVSMAYLLFSKIE